MAIDSNYYRMVLKLRKKHWEIVSTLQPMKDQPLDFHTIKLN